MQEGNKGAAGRCWSGDPEYIEGKVSCIVDERCRTRVCEKHFIDPALYLFLLLLLVFSKKKLTIKENKAKSRLRSSTHTYTQCTRFPPWIFVLFFVGQYPLGFSPHSSVQETTRILASSCVCVSRFFSPCGGGSLSLFL